MPTYYSEICNFRSFLDEISDNGGLLIEEKLFEVPGHRKDTVVLFLECGTSLVVLRKFSRVSQTKVDKYDKNILSNQYGEPFFKSVDKDNQLEIYHIGQYAVSAKDVSKLLRSSKVF